MAKKIKLNGPVIGDGSAWLYNWFGIPYISATRVSKELDDARGDDVELYINSPGGSVFAGSEVYTILKEYAGKVTAKVTGVAASAASFLLMAADEIKMSPTSQLMIHNARTYTEGDKNVHDSNTDMLRGTDVAITNAYRLRTGKTTEELLDLMNKTSWMNAQKAVELGFADGILFDEENSLMAVTNSISGEIPSQIEEKLRDILISAALKGGKVEGLDISALMPQGELQQILNSMENQDDQKNQTKEVEGKMDLEQLKAEHPDLYQAALQAGVEQERTRIKALDDLTMPGNEAIINKAKYETLATAEQTAMAILKSQNEKRIAMATNLTEDAKASGIDGLDAATPDNKTSDELANELGGQMAQIINQGRGVNVK